MNTSEWDHLRDSVKELYSENWNLREGKVVPEPKDIKHGNHAVKLDATILYADLAESSSLVSKLPYQLAGEVYKAYLHCAAKIVKSYGGKIVSYDGDRIMAVFIGDPKNTPAVESAFYIQGAVSKIIQPEFTSHYKGRYSWEIKHGIGIDTGVVHAARIGVRGHGETDSDVVWIGTAANTAAKLANLREPGFSIYITDRVFKNMSQKVQLSVKGDYSPWEACTLTASKLSIHRAAKGYGRWPT